MDGAPAKPKSCPPEGGRYKTETNSVLCAANRSTIRLYKSKAKNPPSKGESDSYDGETTSARP